MTAKYRSGEKGFLLSLASMGTPQPPKNNCGHEDGWGLGRCDFGVHCRSLGERQPCWDHDTPSQKASYYNDLFTNCGERCLLGGGNFWVSL